MAILRINVCEIKFKFIPICGSHSYPIFISHFVKLISFLFLQIFEWTLQLAVDYFRYYNPTRHVQSGNEK